MAGTFNSTGLRQRAGGGDGPVGEQAKKVLWTHGQMEALSVAAESQSRAGDGGDATSRSVSAGTKSLCPLCHPTPEPGSLALHHRGLFSGHFYCFPNSNI